MREQGTAIGSSTVIGIGRGILLKHEKNSLHELVDLSLLTKIGP